MMHATIFPKGYFTIVTNDSSDPRAERMSESISLSPINPNEDDDQPEEVIHTVDEIPGYELLRELGRGGAGVVYLARQKCLDRLVALKMLRWDTHIRPRDPHRLRTEAEALASLYHPNIVQIFEVGECNGLPYLALEYVDGGTLSERLDGTPLPPEKAASLTETLAWAVDAAHQQGIVHRDLKPANVLVATPSGCRDQWILKITDFGLVKRLDIDETTLTGTIVGTPSYMSPEQASGRDDVGRLADVYSLGAILYVFLTGRPPFQAPTPVDTVLQVLHNDPLPPHALQPKVPRDLETICMTCLRKNASGRYASARALAEDLGRFLAHEPIRARRTGYLERAWKWSRRNPAVTVAGLAGIVILIGLTLFSIRLSRSERQAMHEEQTARSVVYDYCTTVSENRLLHEPGMEGLRRELLSRAVNYLEEFTTHQQDRPAVWAELARAYLRLAALTADLGEPESARMLTEKAHSILRTLTAQRPHDSVLAADAGSALWLLGNAYRTVGDDAQAAVVFREANVFWDKVDPVAYNAPEWADRHAATHEQLAEIALAFGRIPDAIVEVNLARQARVPLAAYSEESTYAARSAALYTLTARIERAAGHEDDAEKQLRIGLDLWQKLANSIPPSNAEPSDAWAAAWHQFGLLCMDQSRPGEAAEAFQKAIDRRRQLCRNHSAVPGFRHGLARVLVDLARLHFDYQRPYLGEPLANEALGILDPLVEEHPTVVGFRRDAARCRDLLIPWYGTTLRGELVERTSQTAAVYWAQLSQRVPEMLEDRLGLADHQLSLADACVALGKYGNRDYFGDASRGYHEALRQFEELMRGDPSLSATLGAARAQRGLGLVAMIHGRFREGTALLEAARRRYEALIHDHPHLARCREGLAECLDLLAELRSQSGQASEGVAVSKTALATRNDLVHMFPTVSAFQNDLAGGHNTLGMRLADAHLPAESAVQFETAVRLRETLLKGMPVEERQFQFDAQIRFETTRTLLSLEETYHGLGQTQPAQAALEKALLNQETLAVKYPQVAAYQNLWADCHHRAAQRARQANRLADAEAAYYRALTIREPLANSLPGDRGTVLGVLGEYLGLARVALGRLRLPIADDWSARAVAKAELVLGANPDWPDAQTGRRSALRLRAAVLALQDQSEAAAAIWRQLAQSGGENLAEAATYLADWGLPGWAATLAGVEALLDE